jgi:hypothetical protein
VSGRTPEEARAYSKGYQAGRKYIERSYDRELANEERERFRRKAALAALNGMLIAGGWGTTDSEGKHHPYTDMNDYARAAFQFADKLAAHSVFTGLSLKATGGSNDPR